MNLAIENMDPPLPGDRVVVGAEYGQLFPWEAGPDEFLDRLEADVLEELEALGYRASLSSSDVVLRESGFALDSYYGRVTFVLEAVPVDPDGTARMNHAGLPLVVVLGSVLFAIGAGLGLVIAYRVADVDVLSQAHQVVEELGDTIDKTRNLVTIAAASIAGLYLLFKYR